MHAYSAHKHTTTCTAVTIIMQVRQLLTMKIPTVFLAFSVAAKREYYIQQNNKYLTCKTHTHGTQPAT